MEILELAAILVQGGLPVAAIVVCYVLWRENKRVQARFEAILDELLQREIFDAQTIEEIRSADTREKVKRTMRERMLNTRNDK